MHVGAFSIPMFHNLWNDVVCLHHGVSASVMVHGDKNMIQ
jgi:hypothetical protein